VVRDALQKKFPRELMIKLIGVTTQPIGADGRSCRRRRDVDSRDILNKDVKVWQRIKTPVAFLAAQPWRALFCTACGKRFAADNPVESFVVTLAQQKPGRASKLASWHEHKDEWSSTPTDKSKNKSRRKK